jgi:metal-responsive CopG/Arc/MetJ family transcriptional regulator
VKVKTSVTLPADLLASIDRVGSSRSVFLERASRAYLSRLRKVRSGGRDLRIINANAKRLNREALDVLEYQGLP